VAERDPEKPAPDLIRGGNRFSEKIMLKQRAKAGRRSNENPSRSGLRGRFEVAPVMAALALAALPGLNAMTSDQLVAFVERKLTAHGVKKIVPEKEHLAEAYRLFDRGHHIEQIVEQELKKFENTPADIPDDIDKSVSEILVKEPALRWIDAVQRIAQRKVEP